MDFSQPPVENYANPKTCFFHVLFKAAALAFYILSALFFDSFVIIFVVTVLLAALDFWVVKNVSGRILVGLRWWNEINDLGESVWKFECLDQDSLARMNKKDSWLFWWTLYLSAVAWIVLGIFSLIRFQADYLLVVGVCLTLNIANIIGFTKCRKDSAGDNRYSPNSLVRNGNREGQIQNREMLQCIFLLSDSGEVMLEKQLTGHRVDRSICDWFWDHAISQGDSFKSQPVIASPTHYLFQVVREGITFLACTQVEMPPLMAIEFLCRVADVLSDYLGGLNEDVIKDNFVIVYELLDEMIDNGFPLTTEPNILREMIAPPNIVSKVLSVVTGTSSNVSDTLPGATGSCVPWRAADTKYANNEVYVDLVEQMDAVINRDGVLVKCEIYGEVQVNSHLSGLPDLTLSFANPSILDDVRFHPCVRFRPWESNQILSFVPPDGEFKLMSYRVKKLKSTPIYVKPQLTSDAGTCRVNVLVGIRNDPGKTIDSITVQFQLPPCILSADLTSNHGTVNILSNKICSWSIGRIPKDKAPSLSGTLVLETESERLHVFPTFRVGFRIMGVALSGLQIDKLDLRTVPNRLYKGFRALTRAGEFEVRS
ncbi:Clathrin adaptor, mu subunit [Corchorus olitorius]|uniref:Clathrin adaptor, mu subunit n=1 Tax=Corchorus olitorius TaxID=93759 RepID=A0A1R3KQT3_9ROSI|nr:Clathrin adaptor, mu subunit [Corchorus olitorius]